MMEFPPVGGGREWSEKRTFVHDCARSDAPVDGANRPLVAVGTRRGEKAFETK
jgi:hypothetical protein